LLRGDRHPSQRTLSIPGASQTREQSVDQVAGVQLDPAPCGRVLVAGIDGVSVVSIWCIRTGEERPAVRNSEPRENDMTPELLDVVVPEHDLAEHGLCRGDFGTVVEVYAADAIAVEFVAASGRTQALVTLHPNDVRHVHDDDLVSVRPTAGLAS
jgi:hypothetical protein